MKLELSTNGSTVYDVLKCCRNQETQEEVKRLWQDAENIDAFEKAVLETNNKELLSSEAYSNIYKHQSLCVRELYAKRMYERVIAEKELSPQVVVSKFYNGMRQVVLLVEGGRAEIAIDEETAPDAAAAPLGVVIFDYTHVEPDQFRCNYPFNRHLITEGGHYFIHLNHGSTATVAFCTYTGGEVEITPVELTSGHYLVCAICGYVFIAKLDKN